jgi:hypothetical protein
VVVALQLGEGLGAGEHVVDDARRLVTVGQQQGPQGGTQPAYGLQLVGCGVVPTRVGP